MRIIPKPDYISETEGKTVFSKATEIISPITIIEKELKFLDFERSKANKAEFIIADTDYDYELVIDGDIKAVSRTNEGLFHAAMTLKQLIFDTYTGGISEIENCTIKDKPRFEYRGFMLDIVRHFFGKDIICELIDVLALAKCNVMHLHLSDNQGYRLESKAFPILNEKGNFRKGTRGDGKPVGGYLKASEVEEIVAYAAERYIEIVPEIDLPGHTVAMLAAMPEMGCTGEVFDVAERFGIDDRILCVGREENYPVIEKILEEVAAMFPSKYFHIGGDEVPKTKWENCDKCKGVLKREGLSNFEHLQGYFTNRVTAMLKKFGKTAIVWNEALYSGMLDKSAVCQYWSDGKKAERVVSAAREGRKIIVSRCTAYYLDYPYGMNKLKSVYNFEPLSLFDEASKKNVLGIEAPLWTEYVDTRAKIHYQVFPRLFAVAESGWSSSQKDYKDFIDRLYNVLGILQANEIEFADVRTANPDFIRGTATIVKFGLKIIDVDMFRSAKNAKNANKAR